MKGGGEVPSTLWRQARGSPRSEGGGAEVCGTQAPSPRASYGLPKAGRLVSAREQRAGIKKSREYCG